MVKPYLHDLRYMFPTKIEDVDEMCKMWSQFVDCVRRYVSSCFSEERRTKFNSAVESSVDTVHAICSSDSVQKEYLSTAECFRRVSVERCGSFYKQLIEFVSNPKAHDDHICCQFIGCVNEPLLRECGHRSRNLMEHSMGFLMSRCSKKSVSPYERCPTPPPIQASTATSPQTSSSFHDSNDISQRARADKAFKLTYSTQIPNSITYTLPPETGSRTSTAITFSSPTIFVYYSTLFTLFFRYYASQIDVTFRV
ncbi:hypothetical protein B4U80_08449 [Leptotrombidium deliense]|uniref:Uncharacterized protein n=1 Tax=Leptotrombidium deliense TaxID=299467 RepID=A0A443SGD3_9ACAR|nr:hypothetical protein B4U80_08449 [Leptotrombidium deliense]